METALTQVLLSAPPAWTKDFRQSGRFFSGPSCTKLGWLLQKVGKLPVPSKEALMLGLEAAASELEMGGFGTPLLEDALILYDQWRLRHIARRARCFLLGKQLDPADDCRDVLKEIRALEEMLQDEPQPEAFAASQASTDHGGGGRIWACSSWKPLHRRP